MCESKGVIAMTKETNPSLLFVTSSDSEYSVHTLHPDWTMKDLESVCKEADLDVDRVFADICKAKKNSGSGIHTIYFDLNKYLKD